MATLALELRPVEAASVKMKNASAAIGSVAKNGYLNFEGHREQKPGVDLRHGGPPDDWHLPCAAKSIVGPFGFGDVYFLGLGQKSCGAFIAATAGVPPGQYRVIQRQDGEYTNELSRYQQWMMGLASGYNAAHLEDTKLQLNVDIAALDLWMRNWCNKNPTKLLMSAGLAFIDEMMLGH
jgi:hypothetical protein